MQFKRPPKVYQPFCDNIPIIIIICTVRVCAHRKFVDTLLFDTHYDTYIVYPQGASGPGVRSSVTIYAWNFKQIKQI